jgi:hypothetical protein
MNVKALAYKVPSIAFHGCPIAEGKMLCSLSRGADGSYARVFQTILIELSRE